MARQPYDPTVHEQTVRAWLAAHLGDGATMQNKQFTAWRAAQPHPVPSAAPLWRHFDVDSWHALVLHLRPVIAELLGAATATVTVPVMCTGTGVDRWEDRDLRQWLDDAGCRCDRCTEPTIATAYPHLLPLLADPDEAQRAVSRWVGWQLCTIPEPIRAFATYSHGPVQGRADHVAAGQRYCGACRSHERFHANYPPGALFDGDGDGARSKLEAQVIAVLNTDHADIGAVTGQRIALAADAIYPTPSVQPDVLLMHLRVAVEIDGGTGSAPTYSRHDTPDGIATDTLRDIALVDVGWQVWRYRHPNAAALPDSPATIFTGPLNARRIAQRIAEQARRCASTTG
jgi:hypothetical protein